MLRVKLLEAGARAPMVAHPGEDLGYDVFALETAVMGPRQTVKVRTGIAVEARDPQIASSSTSKIDPKSSISLFFRFRVVRKKHTKNRPLSGLGFHRDASAGCHFTVLLTTERPKPSPSPGPSPLLEVKKDSKI